MTEKKTCLQVEKEIRAGLPVGFAEAVRFDVRQSKKGLRVVVPNHRLGKIAITATCFNGNSDLVGRTISHFTQIVPEGTVVEAPRNVVCDRVRRAIRATLPKDYATAVRFDVRSARDGLAVMIPAHRANGIYIDRQRFELPDPDRLVTMAVRHICQFVPTNATV
jgi:hypothetical protein